MKRQKSLLGGIALLGICSAVLVSATNFQLYPVAAGDVQKVKWPSTAFPLTWSLNPSNTIVYTGGTASDGTTLAAQSDLESVLDSAFGLWSGAQVQATNVNTLAFSEGGTNTNTSFNGLDCVNSIGFTGSLATGIIAATVITEVHTTAPGAAAGAYDCTAAPKTRTCPNEVCIVDTDIEFNNNVNFYTSSYTAPPGSYFDLETTATHEIGHMIGLDHSGLANAIMFPYGDNGTGGIKHELAIDDAIGSSVLYTNPAIQGITGAISGTVKVGGSAAFAAHVVAIDSSTGNVVTDTLSDPDGNYRLQVFQGTYNVLALPLATDTSGTSTSNGVTTVNNYLGFACAYASTPSSCTGLPANAVDFTGTYY
ncbi:MAG: matrixin family metalloprotease [Terriglobia bacterium]